jgi:hypothetical protein
MSDDNPKRSTEADADLQREICAERKFTLDEAIGRMAGPGMMKGVSPVSDMQQAVAEIQLYLSRHSGGDLPYAFLRHVKESEVLLRGFKQPLAVLADCVQKALNSEYLLKELVREANVECGREFGERPYGEKDVCPPDPDDPYTLESVRTALTQLARALAAGEA